MSTVIVCFVFIVVLFWFCVLRRLNMRSTFLLNFYVYNIEYYQLSASRYIANLWMLLILCNLYYIPVEQLLFSPTICWNKSSSHWSNQRCHCIFSENLKGKKRIPFLENHHLRPSSEIINKWHIGKSHLPCFKLIYFILQLYEKFLKMNVWLSERKNAS